MNNLKALGFFQ